MTKKSAAVSEIIDNIRRVFQVVNEHEQRDLQDLSYGHSRLLGKYPQ